MRWYIPAGPIQIADVYEVSLDYLAGRTDNTRGLYAEQSAEHEAVNDADINSRFEKLESELDQLKAML